MQRTGEIRDSAESIPARPVSGQDCQGAGFCASAILGDQRGQASLIEFSQLVSYDFAFQGAT